IGQASPSPAAAAPGGRKLHGWLRPAQPPPVIPPLPDDPPLTAEGFTEEIMLRRRRHPPEGGWRRRVFVATGGYVDPGPSAAQRRQAELIERVRRPVRDCRRIVVLSRKGGAGKTTTTLMLGHTLAMHRGDRVVALDANPDAGSMPYRIDRQNRATLTTLLADVDRMASYADVRAHTSQSSSRLEVVASDDDPRISQGMGQSDYHRAIELLDRHYMLVLMDTGTGILDDAIQGILREADQVVVVMPPALDGARVAASTLDWLDRHGMSGLVKGAVAVLNGVRSEGGMVQLDEIEKHFRARCAAVVRIPWDRALEAGARTSLEELRPATREAYLDLAAAVADGFALPGRRS
ncbi:MAG TPA: MinD/ParA family protein, partial [Kineosporiaceae bacterium]|nr:MinD/ParA family protein [Kineosporiaceae bacterium]